MNGKTFKYIQKESKIFSSNKLGNKPLPTRVGTKCPTFKLPQYAAVEKRNEKTTILNLIYLFV